MRLTKLGTWAIVLGLSLPVWAAEQPGAISGYVRNDSGTPQMGAVVQILGAANRTFTVFTDAAGYYAATGLLPGFYTLRVTAPSFLPAMRERVGLRSGASLNVNVTLSTLLGAMQLGPIRSLPDNDDWKWTLRSVANRPILRVFDDPTPVSLGTSPENEKQTHELSGAVSFLAGSVASGYGAGSDMSTAFTLERSIFSEGHFAFSGDVGYGSGNLPAGALRASYSHTLADGSVPTLALTARRFTSSDPNLHNAALQALALSAGDNFTVGDVLEFKFGSELQTIQFLGHVSAFRPYASADLHLSPNTVLEYDYASSRPDMRNEKGFDSAPADLSESNPRVSLLNFAPQMESAHHQELGVSHRFGKNKVQFAAFTDHVADPALAGTGFTSTAGGFILPDISAGTFSYEGKNLDTNGVRVVLERKFSNDLTATLDYALGGVLDLSQPDVQLQQAQQFMTTQRRHALAAKMSGTMSHSHTRWIASYRWVNGQALTPVDMFNASPGQSDPYLNIFIRQPIPCMGGRIEAIVDLRNLLAQGYVPVLGQDGQTVYLVQAARSVRGGVAFTF
ncbi:MAG: carboxypeptidase-like regulatory domain-containing protein [Candidatus Sulfotelmatobacter sp.]